MQGEGAANHALGNGCLEVDTRCREVPWEEKFLTLGREKKIVNDEKFSYGLALLTGFLSLSLFIASFPLFFP